MAKRGYRTLPVKFNKTEATIYASHRMADALHEITANSTVYEGVRLAQILETVYTQGKKDGARTVFEQWEKSAKQWEKNLVETKHKIPHKKPGRPKKR
jgi:hypothetical protein